MTAFSNVTRSNDLDVIGRRVLLRADLDVPVSSHGAVLDDALLRDLLPTLRGLRERRAKVIVAASFGTPEAPAPQATQEAVADRLGALLGAPVVPLTQRGFDGEIWRLSEGQVALFPNLARVPEEVTNDAPWALSVAKVVDVYLNDAIRASAFRTASVDAIPRRLAARGSGPLLTHELEVFFHYAEAISRPLTAVIGGGRVLDRKGFLQSVFGSADTVLLGGVAANTFLAASGVPVGASVVDTAGIAAAAEMMREAHQRGVVVRLPVDAVVATRAPGTAPVYSVKSTSQIGANDAIVDIAIETCLAYRSVLTGSPTVLLNGVMGECAGDETESGTIRMAQAATEASRYSLAVGARTVETLRRLRLDSLFRDVALGGDASLALLRGTVMPGIESLRPSIRDPGPTSR